MTKQSSIIMEICPMWSPIPTMWFIKFYKRNFEAYRKIIKQRKVRWWSDLLHLNPLMAYFVHNRSDRHRLACSGIVRGHDYSCLDRSLETTLHLPLLLAHPLIRLPRSKTLILILSSLSINTLHPSDLILDISMIAHISIILWHAQNLKNDPQHTTLFCRTSKIFFNQ